MEREVVLSANVLQPYAGGLFLPTCVKGAVIKSVTFYFFRKGFLILFSLIISKLQE